MIVVFCCGAVWAEFNYWGGYTGEYASINFIVQSKHVMWPKQTQIKNRLQGTAALQK